MNFPKLYNKLGFGQLDGVQGVCLLKIDKFSVTLFTNMPVLVLILLFFLVAFGYIFYAYNRLTQLRNAAEAEWADVDVLLKKRWDLIPNLVEVVKGYAKHERETLESIAKERSRFQTGGPSGEEATNLSGFIASILALRERYPDLKANASFLEFQSKLFEIEKEIAATRTRYNNLVKAHNDFVLKFPGNFVAMLTGFALIDLFDFKESREIPAVDFNDLYGR